MTASSPTPLFDWTPPRWMAERDAGMAQVEANAGPNFKAEALKFIVKFLRENGDQSGGGDKRGLHQSRDQAARCASLRTCDENPVGG